MLSYMYGCFFVDSVGVEATLQLKDYMCGCNSQVMHCKHAFRFPFSMHLSILIGHLLLDLVYVSLFGSSSIGV